MIENVYPLSPLQEGIYYHWLVAPEAPVYFDQMSYVMQGQLELEKIEAAYQKLVARHAILRTFFTQEFGDKALQVVRTDISGDFLYEDCSGIESFNSADYKAKDRAKGFNLESGSQMRLTVLGLGNNTYEFIWSFHHILMDGWCVGILVGEFFQFYMGLLSGVEPTLGRVYTYASYIEWLSQIDQQESLAYWQKYLEGYEPISQVPKTNEMPGLAYHLKEESFALDASSREALLALCAQMGITENTFMQAAWGILLSRYNNTNDVVFGTVVSGRPAEVEGVEGIIGLFINTIPVRVCFYDTDTGRQLLQNLHQASIEGTSHHYTQLAQIQAENSAGQELMNHILVFENYPVQKMIAQDMETHQGEQQGLSLLSSENFEQTSYDFNVIIVPGDELVIRFSHNAKAYNADSIARIKSQFLNVIRQLLYQPDILVNDITYLDKADEDLILNVFNNTSAHYPRNENLVSLFEQQVLQTPDKTALIFGDSTLSYQQLNEQANRLAATIMQGRSIQPDECIGILLPKSDLLLIAILGVLKTGAAYVPIDMDNPLIRNEFIINDTGISIMITLPELMATMPYYVGKVITPYMIDPLATVENPAIAIKPNQLAYIIYTSGTTGKPKGVLVEHRNAVRLVKGTDYITLTGNEVMLATSATAFDASIFEFFGMLLNGGTLVLCGNDVLLDEELLSAHLKKHGVNTMWFTTGLINQLVDRDIHLFEGLTTVVTGGERMSIVHMHKLRKQYPALQIVHVYGPTENGTFSTYFPVGEVLGQIPIGKAIHNSTAYIINRQQQLAGIGIIAEICVGGDGLARGYWNRPELTAEKFVANPFVPGERMYRTGDLGRWLPDGNIEFIGRGDEQVKIRGFRVELGEIEHALQTHPAIESAVVGLRFSPDGDKELVAYIVGKENISDATLLSTHLAGLLPYYMVPATYVQLEALPLNTNGKVDRKRLPNPEGLGLGSGVEYVAPRNETEEKLVQIWKEVLGREKIGIKDNFFIIGGHSLKATRMTSQVRKVFDVTITMPVLFSNPTIEHLATEIDKIYWANNELFDIEDGDNITI